MLCSKCGRKNDEDAVYCKYCGEKLKSDAYNNEIRCEYCGLKQPSTNHYCTSCGRSLHPEELRCSFCGFPLEMSWEYCPSCGVSVKANVIKSPYIMFENGYKLWLPRDMPKEGIIIGRSKIPASIDEELRLVVSKKHFKIYIDNGDYMLVDMGSTNGTIVDGIKLEKNIPARLEDGSQILIAGCIMAIFKEGDADGKKK